MRFLARQNVGHCTVRDLFPSSTRLETTSKQPRVGIRTPCKWQRTEGPKVKDQLEAVPSGNGASGPAVHFLLSGARLRGPRGFQRPGSALRCHTAYQKQHRTCAIPIGLLVGPLGVSFLLLGWGTRAT